MPNLVRLIFYSSIAAPCHCLALICCHDFAQKRNLNMVLMNFRECICLFLYLLE